MATENDREIRQAETFLISEDDIARICRSRATHNNSRARQCGQNGTVTVSELKDLYCNQRGRCGMCTEGLRIETIQLDHIVEARYRAALSARVSGSGVLFGEIANINNMQWVCRKCNALKELCKRNSIDLSEYVSRVSDQAQKGFPIRANAKHLGTRGHAEYRREVIVAMMAADALVSSRDVHDALAGTPGEACYAIVLDDMKALGWRDQLKGSYREKREAAIRAVVQEHGTHYDTNVQFAELVVSQLQKLGTSKKPGPQIIKETALAMNLVITFERVQKRSMSPSAGDKAACMDMLRSAEDEGLLDCDVVEMLCNRGLNEAAARCAINEMKQSQCIYERCDDGVLLAALNRAEAAKRIGVTKNTLKKWASTEFSYLAMSPVFSKGGYKQARTWYRRDDCDLAKSRLYERRLPLVEAC